MKITTLIWICIVLLAMLLILSFSSKASPQDHRVDSLFINEEKTVVICFDRKDCFLLDYKDLYSYSKRKDLTVKTTTTIPFSPMAIPTPQP